MKSRFTQNEKMILAGFIVGRQIHGTVYNTGIMGSIVRKGGATVKRSGSSTQKNNSYKLTELGSKVALSYIAKTTPRLRHSYPIMRPNKKNNKKPLYDRYGYYIGDEMVSSFYRTICWRD